MGITIHHKMRTKKVYVKNILDDAQKLAENIKQHQADALGYQMEIRRENERALYIDIDGCETLAFAFKTAREIVQEKEEKDYSYLYNVATNDGREEIDEGYKIEEYPQNENVFCADFCKTQFAPSVVCHKWVCDIIRAVAGRCEDAHVYDEADYYYSNDIEYTKDEIAKLGDMINGLGNMLAGQGFEVVGNKTTITSTKKGKQ